MAIKREFKNHFRDDEDGQAAGDFEQMLTESFGKGDRKISVGDRIKSEVLSVGKDNVIVSTGTRHDGFVPAAQLLNDQGTSKVKVGDHIDLFVTYVKGPQVYLSPNPTAQNLADDIAQAYAQNLAIEGRVEGVNKGGFQVIIMNKAAFCPISQMDLKRIEKPEDYVGKRFEFKITQVTEGGRNVVVSRRRVLEENQGAALSTFQDQRKPGDIVSGTVKRLESFGAFIEIAPGLEGLAHISELGWTRVKDPKDAVEVGQVVSAKILRIENDGGRLKISLTLKQSENDPWQNLPAEIQSGRVVSGKVTRCMPFGAFVELQPGIEGLVPLSEMSHTKRVTRSDEFMKEGEVVSVVVKDINPQSKRISLSLKEAGEVAANISEKEDMKNYMASQAASQKSSANSMGDLGAKLQAAMAKKK